MSAIEFVAAVVAVLAWPACIVVVAMLVRPRANEVHATMRYMEGFDGEKAVGA
jgi:hypothetical protein